MEEAERLIARRDFRAAHELCIAELKRNPRKARALFLLAIIAAEHANHGKALDILDRASVIAPDPDIQAQRARSLLALSRPREALLAARHGLTLAQQIGTTNAWTFDTLAVALTRAGAHDEAVAPFRRAIALDPGQPSYHYNLGAALQFVGAFADAEQAYRACIGLDRMNPKVWSALAQVRKGALSEEDASFLVTQADTATDADAMLHWTHALAKYWEDQGQLPRAMNVLAPAKRRKRSEQGYRFDVDAELFCAAEESFASLPKSGGHASVEPIFIFGMPRTGTTLVERILSSHPDVFAAGELSHFSLALKRYARTSSRYVLDSETLHSAHRVSMQRLGEAYVQSTRPRTGHTARFIDKMPLNFFYAGIIHRSLPKARIVCVQRHPLDTIVSNYRQLFATGFTYYNYAYDLLDSARYWMSFRRLCDFWREALGDSYLEVRYEDVVDDLPGSARRLLQHLDLPWNDACLAFHENTAPVATASSVQVRQPLYRTSVARWRQLENELAPVIALLEENSML